jgi:hypothetical protein
MIKRTYAMSYQNLDPKKESARGFVIASHRSWKAHPEEFVRDTLRKLSHEEHNGAKLVPISLTRV